MLYKLKHRRLLSVLAVLLLMAALISQAGAVSVSDFGDVSAGAWYYDAVSFAVNRGLFNGTTATTFSPNGTMTRGMFIAVLGRYAGVDPDAWRAGTVQGSGVNLRSGPGLDKSVITTMMRDDKVTILGKSGDWYYVRYGSRTGYASKDYVKPTYHVFTDVDYSQYYAGYAIWGFERGIVSGMGTAELYAPNQNVTREQICKLIQGYVKFAGLTLSDGGSAGTFADQSDISSWAVEGVTAMQRAGIVVGESGSAGYRFRPRSSATRAEAATIFRRLAGAGGGTNTPSPTNTPAPTQTPDSGGSGLPQDTPATFLSDAVAVKAGTLRIGILVNTQSTKNAVQTVNLNNTNGTGFEYGVFDSDRSFRKMGEIGSTGITITTNGSMFTVKDGNGTVVHTTTGDLAIHPVANGSAVTRVNGSYRYFGDFALLQAYGASGYISVVNYVGVEDYVKGVMPYEFDTEWPAETLKAAAVTVRSYAMAEDWSTYSRYGFDLINNTSSQVYHGRGVSYSDSYFAASDAAVDATRNVYLTYSSGGTNKICTAFYSSCDGGATENASNIWGGSYSYLIGKKDPYEAPIAAYAPNYTKSITNSRTGSVMSSLAQRAGLGSTTIAKNGIRIDTYPATGNVRSITLTGDNGRTVTLGQNTSFGRLDFLSAFGFTAYSYRYTVTYDEVSDTFTCTRSGWGHNIGMSQWGAYAMARYYNKSYQDILGFYFDGTHLQYGVN